MFKFHCLRVVKGPNKNSHNWAFRFWQKGFFPQNVLGPCRKHYISRCAGKLSNILNVPFFGRAQIYPKLSCSRGRSGGWYMYIFWYLDDEWRRGLNHNNPPSKNRENEEKDQATQKRKTGKHQQLTRNGCM